MGGVQGQNRSVARIGSTRVRTGGQRSVRKGRARLAQHRECSVYGNERRASRVSDRQAPIAVQFIIEQLEGSDEKLVIFGHRDVLALAKEQLAAYKPVMFVGGMSAED